jgi:hypothetical protein
VTRRHGKPCESAINLTAEAQSSQSVFLFSFGADQPSLSAMAWQERRQLKTPQPLRGKLYNAITPNDGNENNIL